MIYNPRRIAPVYGKESFKYAVLKCGHIGQNILLMAIWLGLGAVPIGAFDNVKVGKIPEIEEL